MDRHIEGMDCNNMKDSKYMQAKKKGKPRSFFLPSESINDDTF